MFRRRRKPFFGEESSLREDGLPLEHVDGRGANDEFFTRFAALEEKDDGIVQLLPFLDEVALVLRLPAFGKKEDRGGTRLADRDLDPAVFLGEQGGIDLAPGLMEFGLLKGDVDRRFLAFLQAGLLQALEEALAAVVQGGMLAVLRDADEVLFGRSFGLGSAGRLGGGRLGLLAAAGGEGEGKGQRQNGGSDLTEVFHDDISCSVIIFWKVVDGAHAAAPSFRVKFHIQTSGIKNKKP